MLISGCWITVLGTFGRAAPVPGPSEVDRDIGDVPIEAVLTF